MSYVVSGHKQDSIFEQLQNEITLGEFGIPGGENHAGRFLIPGTHRRKAPGSEGKTDGKHPRGGHTTLVTGGGAANINPIMETGLSVFNQTLKYLELERTENYGSAAQTPPAAMNSTRSA